MDKREKKGGDAMSVTMKTHTDYDQPHLEELQRVAGHTFAKKQTMFKRGFALVSGLFCLGSRKTACSCVCCAAPWGCCW